MPNTDWLQLLKLEFVQLVRQNIVYAIFHYILTSYKPNDTLIRKHSKTIINN